MLEQANWSNSVGNKLEDSYKSLLSHKSHGPSDQNSGREEGGGERTVTEILERQVRVRPKKAFKKKEEKP